MRGITERSGRLRSNTAINPLLYNPACRLRRPYGVNIKRHGFAVIIRYIFINQPYILAKFELIKN